MVELGRHLFYDPRLSVSGTLACAGCHQQVRAFSDGQSKAIGATGERLRRNTPSLTNVGLNKSWGWAGEFGRLEDQHLVPLTATDPVEMGLAGHLAERLAELARLPRYRRLLADAGVEVLTVDAALAALAGFVRELTSFRAPFDAFISGDDENALGAAARRGMRLFFSDRLRCSACHASVNFSGPLAGAAADVFHNTGLYNLDGLGSVPDPGREAITGRPRDRGAFRAPTLRNLTVTAPYMHDGSLATLDEVLTHYASGGRNAPTGVRHPQQRAEVGGFSLSESERADLIAFLSALTDLEFTRDPRLADPWRPGALPFSRRPVGFPRPYPDYSVSRALQQARAAQGAARSRGRASRQSPRR